jgi:hypothetical protein
MTKTPLFAAATLLLATPLAAQTSPGTAPAASAPAAAAPLDPATVQKTPPVIVASPYAPSAASPMSPVTPTPASLAKARALAALLNGDDVTRIQFDKMFSKTMPEAMRQVPAYQQLEQQYPGIIMAIVNGSRPIIEAKTNERKPELIARLSALYAGYMTDAELGKALDFYGSPTGKWVIQTVATNSDAAAVMQRGIENPETAMTPEDVTNSTINPALPTLVAGMTPERLKTATAFAATSAGRKVKALQPQINQAAADWANKLKVDAGSEVGTAMIGIAQSYIAAHGGSDKPAAGS